MKSQISDETFQKAISQNLSAAGALRAMGLVPNGGNYLTMRRRIRRLQLDISHWTGSGHLKGKTHTWGKSIPLSEILIVDSNYCSTSSLKKRILKENLIPYECNICKLSEWQAKPISLQLDHINGINDDHRLENLRFLCPNCHSQTPTFAGRNIGLYFGHRLAQKIDHDVDSPKFVNVIAPNLCLGCGLGVDRRASRCKSCVGKLRPNKIEWPDIATLITMVEASSYLAVGKQLGVSDNAVRKRLRNHGGLTG